MFSSRALFDFEHSPAAKLLSGVSQVWEAVPILPDYIERCIRPGVRGEVEEGAWLEPGAVELAEGSRVERGAVVRGPTIIGPGTVIRSHAYIRGHVMIGARCLIGHATELRQVLMLDESYAPHFNAVFTSLLGNRVRLGGGVLTANLLQSGKAVDIRLGKGDQRVAFPTGQTYFGAVIGDDVNIGAASLLMPGTLIGRRTLIYPYATVSGVIPEDSRVKPRYSGIDIEPLRVRQ